MHSLTSLFILSILESQSGMNTHSKTQFFEKIKCEFEDLYQIQPHYKNKQQKCRGSTEESLHFAIYSSDPLCSVTIMTAADQCAVYNKNICCAKGIYIF